MITPENAGLLVIDVQDRLFPKILALDHLLARIPVLIKGCHALGVPILVSEQYPMGLGPTIKPIREVLPTDATVMEKTSFSCLNDGPIRQKIDAWVGQGRNHLILCGIETHICVMQTAFDAKNMGLTVMNCWDAISSRYSLDRETAIRRMEHHGIIGTTTESVLFQMIKDSVHPQFKSISGWVKTL